MKIRFRATAYNDKGLTFGFFFLNENWYGIDQAARRALDEIVSKDSLHQKNGPWNFRAIDRG